MSEHPVCKGCHQHMTSGNDETGTHTLDECYVARIKQLERDIERLKKKNNRLACLRWFAERYNMNEIEALLAVADSVHQRIWRLVDTGWLGFDFEWNVVVPDRIKDLVTKAELREFEED